MTFQTSRSGSKKHQEYINPNSANQVKLTQLVSSSFCMETEDRVLAISGSDDHADTETGTSNSHLGLKNITNVKYNSIKDGVTNKFTFKTILALYLRGGRDS